MPVAEFAGSRNWGYDGVFPFAPSHIYGTPSELCSLVDYAHSLNIAVILDVVYTDYSAPRSYRGFVASTFLLIVTLLGERHLISTEAQRVKSDSLFGKRSLLV